MIGEINYDFFSLAAASFSNKSNQSAETIYGRMLKDELPRGGHQCAAGLDERWCVARDR